VKALRVALFVCGIGLLAYLIARVGTDALVSVLSRLAWWQFVLICLPYGLIMAVDTLGWRYAFAGKPPPYLRMLAARTAGEALNIVAALGSVGGEAVKVWLLRPAVPYHESVPSIVIAKTTSTIAQTLFLLLGLILAVSVVPVAPRVISTMLVLLAVESSDLVFAVDSIPAIYAVTDDPFIVFTSNVFAILGLRSLYFVQIGRAHV